MAIRGPNRGHELSDTETKKLTVKNLTEAEI